MPLDDIIEKNLKLLICGLNIGRESDDVRHYYAHKNNIFWKVLHKLEMTDRELSPCEDRKILGYKIGLTTLINKGVDGDGSICSADDRNRLRDLIEKYTPQIIAFTGRVAPCYYYNIAEGHFRREIGWKDTGRNIHGTQVWVVPMTLRTVMGHKNQFNRWKKLAEAFHNLGSYPRQGRKR